MDASRRTHWLVSRVLPLQPSAAGPRSVRQTGPLHSIATPRPQRLPMPRTGLQSRMPLLLHERTYARARATRHASSSPQHWIACCTSCRRPAGGGGGGLTTQRNNRDCDLVVLVRNTPSFALLFLVRVMSVTARVERCCEPFIAHEAEKDVVEFPLGVLACLAN